MNRPQTPDVVGGGPWRRDFKKKLDELQTTTDGLGEVVRRFQGLFGSIREHLLDHDERLKQLEGAE